jgi:hypothetical protein
MYSFTPNRDSHYTSNCRLGWKVIVYDRFGFHREFIEDLLSLPGFDYHPYTMFQTVNPSKYSAEYGKNQGFGYKIYYSMEKNWGYGKETNGQCSSCILLRRAIGIGITSTSSAALSKNT